jgi:hypothetical protein
MRPYLTSFMINIPVRLGGKVGFRLVARFLPTGEAAAVYGREAQVALELRMR